MTKLWPDKRQWQKWTLPGKSTFVGALLTIVGVLLMMAIFIFQFLWAIWKDPKQEILHAVNDQGKTLSEIKELLRPMQDTGYRELVATVIHSFEPKADIKVGSWIQGLDGARNIDIEVRSVVDGRPRLMVVEVLDLLGDRKAGVEIIDALDSKRTDIEAEIALVCSNTGFDSIAIRKAKRKRIGLISVLRQGDRRVKTIIEEEIYLRKIRLGPMQINYTGEKRPPDLKVQTHDLRYQGKSVDSWLQQRAALIAISQPELRQSITLRFNLKTLTEFELKDRHVRLRSLSITFYPQTQWLAQTVQVDATTGIYDYLRGRTRLAGGKHSYIIKGVNFDLATPLPTPPSLNDFGVGLFPGELDVSLTMVEGLNLPKGVEIAKLEDIVRPEDLDFHFQPFEKPAAQRGAAGKAKQPS
jgi:hypothetical protein